MRQWHRWVSVAFGIVLLFVGTTGVVIQLLELAKPAARQAATDRLAPAAAATTDRSAGAAAPTATPPARKKTWLGFVKHLHSGETFGPVGILISALSGVALMFFAISGMYMYWRMFTQRRAHGRPGLFWRR